MKHIILTFMAGWLLVFTAGCDSWGDYVHHSDNLDITVKFPVGWVVQDQSSTEHELLIATNPNIANAKIEVSARKVSPDF